MESSASARADTSSSAAPPNSSPTARTGYPAALSARTTAISTLSSARKRTHSSAFQRAHDPLFVSHHSGGIGYGRQDVVSSEARVGIKKVFLASALAQIAQDELHRNAGAADHRLTQHDLRIDIDSVVEG